MWPRRSCKCFRPGSSEKLNLRKTLREHLPELRRDCPILFTQHHQAHAASAFYPSPFEEAAILTVDGVGEYATTAVGRGSAGHLEIRKGDSVSRIRWDSFIRLSPPTAASAVNSGEYKLMGLAPYGEPRFAAAIYDNLLDLKPDGSFWLNLDYFAFLCRGAMTNDRFHRLFDGEHGARYALEQRHVDVARSIQVVTEEIMLRLARHAREITGERNLCR